MDATYAIDAKKLKAQTNRSGKKLGLLEPAEALARITRWRKAPLASEGTDAAVAAVAGFLESPSTEAPEEDLQHALFALLGNTSDHVAFLSLFWHWRGPRGLAELGLGGGRYRLDTRADPSRGVLRADGAVIGGWHLLYLLWFLLERDGTLEPWLHEKVKATVLDPADATQCAILFDDCAWANALIDHWMTIPTTRADSWSIVGLVGATDDDARFAAFMDYFGAQMEHLGAPANLPRAIGRVSVEVFVGALLPRLEDGLAAKWKSSQAEPFAKALAHVRSPDVARVLAAWVGEKSVAKVATDYFRAHPDLSAALAPIAKAKGKAGPIAKAMLASLEREAEAAPAPAKGKGKAKGKEKPAKKAKASKAKPAKATEALPAALRSPPWKKKARPARPRLALALIVEAERYTPASGAAKKTIARDRSPENDARLLGDKSPTELYEPSIFNLTDDVALSALNGRARLNPYSYDGYYLWLGDRVVPHLMHALGNDVELGAWLLDRAVSPRLALGCGRAALKRSGGKARNAALAWLDAHPGVAALGLIPAALGESDADADVAERTLRLLLRGGHGAAVSEAAARYGAEASTALDAVLGKSPYDRVPVKMPPRAKWAAPERLGSLELLAGGALTDADVATFLQMLQISVVDEPYAGVTDVRPLLTPESRTRFARALLEEFVLAGSPPSHEWVIGAIALLDPELAIVELAARMRRWAADGKVPLLHRSLEALAAIDTDEALVVVYDAGQRSRYDDTRDKVRSILEGVAEARKIPFSVLEDVLVPELGLEEGAISLDLGGRSLEVTLGDHLDAVLRDGDGHVISAFPRKSKKDDAEKYAAAKARYATLVESAATVGRGQVLRLERAMREQRAWTVADLRAHVLTQPLLHHLAQRLVWQVLDGGALFRVAEDLTLVDADDEPVAFPPDAARVVIAHPLCAPGLRAFQTWIDDYLVVQPFAQVARETFTLGAAEAAGSSVAGVEGRGAAYLPVLALTTERGWKPVAPGAKGIDAIVREEAVESRPDPLVARLGIRPGLLFGAARGRPAQTLGAFTIATADGEPARFDELDPLALGELLRDVMTLTE
ncbi:MAG: DUF4132 domain-containing protein [Sandaracinaceae bacterium]|nr:DUF4132 domain-containing protein [Sandaracinaceae bacterium]